LWLAAASAAFVGGAWAALGVHHKAVAVALFVGAMVLAARPLRGPTPQQTDSGQAAQFVAFTLFCSELALGLFVTELAVFAGAQPIDILLALILGAGVLGVGLGLAMTWIPSQPVVAPIALGVITVALGTFALQGLGPLFQSATPPNVNGAGLLFIGAPPSQPVHLTASVNFATAPVGFHQLTGEAEQLSITTPPGQGNIRWALLLIGDARLALGCIFCGEQPSPEGSKHLQDVTGWGGGPAAASLYWGTLSGDNSEVISGMPLVSYVSASSSQTDLSLPRYGEGFRNVDGQTFETISKVLGANPVLRGSGDFTVTTKVEPGPTLLNMVTNAIPPLTDPSKFQWQDHSQLSVSFAQLNQGADNDARNALFILGVVLGAAAGALMASLQRVLEILQKVKNPAPPGS
jgi:hypothetical protein